MTKTTTNSKPVDIAVAHVTMRPAINALIEYLGRNYPALTFSREDVDINHVAVMVQPEGMNAQVLNQISALCIGYLDGYKKALTHA